MVLCQYLPVLVESPICPTLRTTQKILDIFFNIKPPYSTEPRQSSRPAPTPLPRSFVPAPPATHSVGTSSKVSLAIVGLAPSTVSKALEPLVNGLLSFLVI